MVDGLYIGTSGWSYRDWKDGFYPPGLPASRYLTEYARHFDAVEVDSTFYGLPRESSVLRWADLTPDGFLFCPKMVRTVTHDKQLVDAEAETAEFIQRLGLLGPKLGPIVLQFDYTFGPDRGEVLLDYLTSLPPGPRFAVEVRNRGWLRESFFEMLTATNTALVLQDLHYMPRLDRVTTDFTYVRWLGRRADMDRFDRLVKDRTRELSWWVEQVSRWLSRGIKVYAFANNHYQGHAPATVQLFLEQLQAHRET